MTDLYERRVEAAQMASILLRTPFGGSKATEVVELTEYLLHGKQTSGEETQTSGSLPPIHNQPVIFGFDGSRDGSVIQTFGDEIDLDALSIRILENLDLIGDASWHEEEEEEEEEFSRVADWEYALYPQPGDADFGEIRVFDDEAALALPVGTRLVYGPHNDNPTGWDFAISVRTSGGWTSGGRPQGERCWLGFSRNGQLVLNPEILGTFRPVEA